MRGEFRSVFDRVYPEIIAPLLSEGSTPRGFLGEICQAVGYHLARRRPTYSRVDGVVVGDIEPVDILLARAVENEGIAESFLSGLSEMDFASESDAVASILSVEEALLEMELEDLLGVFISLLKRFVRTYSLGYYVAADGSLHGSVPGVVASLFSELRRTAAADPYTRERMGDFEHAVADAIADPTEIRLKTALAKNVNLLEALGKRHTDDLGDTLGAMCRNVSSWPHVKLEESAAALVRFTNNYPGIRHGGDPEGRLRRLDERDFVAVALGLLSLVPYLSDRVGDSAGISRFGDRWSHLSDIGVEPLWEVPG